MVMFSSNQTTDGHRKDSVINAEQTGVFIWNMATWALRKAVNVSAQELPFGVDEFLHAGLLKSPGRCVAASRVEASPIQFECEYLQTVRLPGNGPMGTVDVVFGKVVGVHIADAALTADGKVDVLALRPLARMGYFDYTTVESRFEMVIPDSTKLLAGLEGSSLGNVP
jgi:flavin reductase (DIM6/NTAB) family NADH-FMN oxidoreductase RutF